ncbi:hypothetical protein ACIQ9Q_33715 [Streptomyces sp. NPDC094438]|uniref:hypothetical protein n=1 Tax=Streptomyces sp. NPDC094438 TaxID=3366061 RepID=UPI00381117AC
MDDEETQVAQNLPAFPDVTLRGVVRDVVAKTAPEELPLVAALDRFDEAEMGRRFARGPKSREPLGFGLEEVVALTAPVVWTAVQQVANRMAESGADSLVARIRSAVRGRLTRRVPDTPLPRFGDTELAEVRRRVLELAQQSGLRTDRATLLAEAVVGRLALGTLGEDAQSDDTAGEGS